jgi:hypothetical protein
MFSNPPQQSKMKRAYSPLLRDPVKRRHRWQCGGGTRSVQRAAVLAWGGSGGGGEGDMEGVTEWKAGAISSL